MKRPSNDGTKQTFSALDIREWMFYYRRVWHVLVSHKEVAKVAQRGGQVISVDRFFPSSKTCHCCGWKWEDMTLKSRVFVCQNPSCPYDQFPQDRDHNAAQNVLREAFRLIGLLDQVATGAGSDDGVNLAVDAG